MSCGLFRLQCVSGLIGLVCYLGRGLKEMDSLRHQSGEASLMYFKGSWSLVSGFRFRGRSSKIVYAVSLFRRISTAYKGWKYWRKSAALYAPFWFRCIYSSTSASCANNISLKDYQYILDHWNFFPQQSSVGG